MESKIDITPEVGAGDGDKGLPLVELKDDNAINIIKGYKPDDIVWMTMMIDIGLMWVLPVMLIVYLLISVNSQESSVIQSVLIYIVFYSNIVIFMIKAVSKLIRDNTHHGQKDVSLRTVVEEGQEILVYDRMKSDSLVRLGKGVHWLNPWRYHKASLLSLKEGSLEFSLIYGGPFSIDADVITSPSLVFFEEGEPSTLVSKDGIEIKKVTLDIEYGRSFYLVLPEGRPPSNFVDYFIDNILMSNSKNFQQDGGIPFLHKKKYLGSQKKALLGFRNLLRKKVGELIRSKEASDWIDTGIEGCNDLMIYLGREKDFTGIQEELKDHCGIIVKKIVLQEPNLWATE